ncbi:hypothetical protein F4820DRAFT_148479 [Hypoxylon rubiginosum]|uniref:Uncharacterized protein n=1 Tax=Hypoxylon rubiginosum TaxID=110542 RepID=A0ACB9ZJ92_9PEZI|nr:hypothetical protein F4820DRAFT_148479 [Hypoxylon rubiginosum]
MATNNQLPNLPPIPKLLGVENLEQWKRCIIQHRDYYGLKPYFDGTAKEPDDLDARHKYKEERIHAAILMYTSIYPVRELLRAAGLNGLETDPKVLWDLILTAIPKLSAQSFPELLHEFKNANLERGVSLHSFNARFHVVVDRLADIGLYVCPEEKLLHMMLAIKGRYAVWYASLKRDHQDGILTWELLQEEVIRRAKIEENNHCIAFLTDAKNKTRGLTKHDNKAPEVECSFCIKTYPANWPYCTDCSEHHPGGEDRCYALHPELRPQSSDAVAVLADGMSERAIHTGL